MQADNTSQANSATGASRWLVLVGAVAVQLILGTVYGYSIFWEPLESGIFPEVITEAQLALLGPGQDVADRIVVADEAAAEAIRVQHSGYLKYAFSICILSFAVVMVIAGRVQDVKGPRFGAVIGAVLLGGGFIIAGLMNHAIVFFLAHSAFVGVAAIVLMMVYHALFADVDKDKVPVLQYVPMGIVTSAVVAGVLLGNQYVGKLGELDSLFMLWGTVGFLAGAGIGFAYVCPIAALVKWFPEHKGLVSGLAVAGFGFGAYLFKSDTIGAAKYIADHDITDFFVIHGLVCFVVVTLGAMLLRNPPEPQGVNGAAGGAVASDPSNSVWQETLRRPAFYVLWLMFFSGAMAGLMVIGIVKPFVQEQVVTGGLSAAEAAKAGLAAIGGLAIFNAIGRVLWGLASDRIGRTGAFIAMFAIQAVTLLVLGGLHTPTALYVAACAVGFYFGGNFALFPSATADLFGAKNLGANYGWVFTSYGIAGVVGIAAGNAAKQMTGSYAAAFTVAAAMCVVSALLAVTLSLMQSRDARAGAGHNA